MRGNGRIFQRGSRWWIAYYAPKDGRMVEHREPGGQTETDAWKRLRARRDEVTVHKAGFRPFQGRRQERLSVEDLLKAVERDYEIHGRKSLPQLRAHLHHVRTFFGLDRALALTPDRLRDYIAHRQKEEAAPATINRELEGLQRAFALAMEGGTLSLSPKFPALPEHNARQGFFERGEFEAVAANLGDPDVRDFCEWFFYTGMRPGEIKVVTWAAFDRETWTLRLHARDAKTGRGRVLTLEGPIRVVIERRLKARRLDCPLIFHRDGSAIGDFRKIWKSACKAAGLDGKLLYDLRRTAVRNMVRAGVDPAVAMRISGHRTRSVFDRYNIISEADLRDAMAKTTAYVATLPTTPSVVPLQEAVAARSAR